MNRVTEAVALLWQQLRCLYLRGVSWRRHFLLQLFWLLVLYQLMLVVISVIVHHSITDTILDQLW